MRQVRPKRWQEYQGALHADAIAPAFRSYRFHAWRRFFNGLNFLIGLLAVSGFLALFSRTGTVLFISLGLFAAYLFLRARQTADGLSLRRVVPARAIEREAIEVELVLGNQSGFPISGLLVTDRFEGSSEPEVHHWIADSIAPGQQRRLSYSWRCDAGMGHFKAGPLMVVVSDPLGIFEFLVSEQAEARVDVFPRIEPTPELPIRGSKESFTYGRYDIPERGGSQNFMGLRDYVRGDSLRHVAWRVSARNDRFMVKEFERIVNTDVSILLNMDSRVHVGRKSESTWEYCKDVALAVTSQQIANGNGVQLLSNSRFIPLGRGDGHCQLVARSLFDLMPGSETPDLLARYADPHLELIRAGSTAVYVGPVIGKRIEAVIEGLLKLRLRGVSVIAILVDATTFVSGKLSEDIRLLMAAELLRSQGAQEGYRLTLEQAGIPTYVLKNRVPFATSMLARGGFV